MNVMATATSDSAITVSVGVHLLPTLAARDITGYMVQSAYEMSDGTMSAWTAVDPAHTGMDMMYMDMGLMEDDEVLLPCGRDELGRHG